MELEHVLPPINRHSDGERVRDTCQRFAMVLTDKSWQRDDTLHARIQRELKTVISIDEPIGTAGKLTTERRIAVSADFTAEKEQFGFDEHRQKPLYEEVYTISASLREQVRPDELPEWIFEALSTKIAFKKDEDDDGQTLARDRVSLDTLYAFDFEKVSEVEYVINQAGDIDNYSVVCRYLFDNNFIDERSYSWEDEMVEYVTNVIDSKSQEIYTPNDDPLTEEDIVKFQQSFDAAISSLQFDAFEQDATEQGLYITEDTHCRRALGMIALNAKRFIGMRIK